MYVIHLPSTPLVPVGSTQGADTRAVRALIDQQTSVLVAAHFFQKHPVLERSVVFSESYCLQGDELGKPRGPKN